MLISFDKVKKVLSTEEHNEKYASDSDVAGTYVSNMSKDDLLKWKGKHIKGNNERIEIRKHLNGANIVIIVYKDEEKPENDYRGDSKVRISTNSTICLSEADFHEFIGVISEAGEILGSNLSFHSKNIEKEW